jgi:hypothetical protein
MACQRRVKENTLRNLLSSLSGLARRVGLRSSFYAILYWFCVLYPVIAGAQAEDHFSGDLPDAPTAAEATPQAPSTGQNSMEGQQTKRILGIIPNFQSVSVDTKLPPQTVKEKFMDATEDSFDYSAFIFNGALAGIGHVSNSVSEFHQGAAGYGRYYWHTFADQTDENYMVEFVLPTVLHQDGRYYTLGHGGFAKRMAYSFSRVLITRTDSGRETFNASEIVGAGAASGISDLYYPEQERTWTKTGQRWLMNVSLDGATFVVREFWPDINSALFHKKH